MKTIISKSIQSMGVTAIVTGTLTLASCSLDIPYDNQFSDPDAITSVQTARELLATAYSTLPNPEFDLSVLADDFTPTYWLNSNPSLNNQYTWQPSEFVTLGASLWSTYYSVNSTINALLERLPAITVTNAEEQAEIDGLQAEARTLKAYVYFQLLRLFATNYSDGIDKPGIILKDKVEMENLSRSTVGQSVEAIRTLLNRAIATDYTVPSTGWLSHEAALYILAEVELYAGNYEEAQRNAGLVIDTKPASVLAANQYNQLWDATRCEEQIFIYDSPKNASSFYVGMVYDKVTGDYFAVDSKVADAFNPGDIRYDWTIYPVDSPTLGHQNYIGKYNRLRKQQHDINFINKIRLSGAYFIMAEACCLDGKNYDKAREIINEYLTQRGATNIDDDITGELLLQIILQEKHKEFVGEGQRYFDLKHYRSTVLSNWIQGQPAARRIPARDYRWTFPLPKDEYLYNDNVEQNEGWPKQQYN